MEEDEGRGKKKNCANRNCFNRFMCPKEFCISLNVAGWEERREKDLWT